MEPTLKDKTIIISHLLDLTQKKTKKKKTTSLKIQSQFWIHVESRIGSLVVVSNGWRQVSSEGSNVSSVTIDEK